MQSLPKKILIALLLSISFALTASHTLLAEESAKYSMWGTHDQESPIYQPGQPMTFTVKVLKNGEPIDGVKLKWTRTGDDGITKEGECLSVKEGVKIKASTEKPGFVRLYVSAYNENGERIKCENNRWNKYIFFDGGACVAPETLKGLPEPKDFDAFWEKQKKFLADTPMKILEMKEVEGDEHVKAYDMKIACAGGMPVSGYLVMPKNADPKSLPAEVSFRGYGVSGASKNLTAGKHKIWFQINAHGIENGKPQEYYTNLRNTTLRSYGFSAKKNSDPSTTYFRGMFLRIMRALEFVKSLPEWNGKDLHATGGSQGGLQCLAATGLDSDVTYCNAWSPWCCDFGRTKLNRIVGGWYVGYTPALEYFDPINLVKRANPKCELFIVANLGDYVCPPSGVWIAYNNFPGPKKMEVRQGCEHGFTMENYPMFEVQSE